MTDIGILIVSHSRAIATGLAELLDQVAKDVEIGFAGGTADGQIGSDFDQVQALVDESDKETLLAFFDLGSARMNLEMVADFSSKNILIQQVPLIEGAYTAAALLQAGADLGTVQEQLDELQIRK